MFTHYFFQTFTTLNILRHHYAWKVSDIKNCVGVYLHADTVWTWYCFNDQIRFFFSTVEMIFDTSAMRNMKSPVSASVGAALLIKSSWCRMQIRFCLSRQRRTRASEESQHSVISEAAAAAVKKSVRYQDGCSGFFFLFRVKKCGFRWWREAALNKTWHFLGYFSAALEGFLASSPAESICELGPSRSRETCSSFCFLKTTSSFKTPF